MASGRLMSAMCPQESTLHQSSGDGWPLQVTFEGPGGHHAPRGSHPEVWTPCGLHALSHCTTQHFQKHSAMQCLENAPKSCHVMPQGHPSSSLRSQPQADRPKVEKGLEVEREMAKALRRSRPRGGELNSLCVGTVV